jgi:hypothetical protein
VKPLA